MIKEFKSFFRKPERNSDSKKNNLGLIKLTPTANAESHKPYIDALLFGLKEEDVYNIGLTGGYGSGKSSIIESLKTALKKEDEEYKIVTVSLASFEAKSDDEDLEFRIIQQILYQGENEGFEYSRFNRIEKVSDTIVFWRTLLFLSFAVSSIIMFSENYFSMDIILNSYEVLVSKSFIIPLLFIISFSRILYIFIKFITKQFHSKGFKSLNVKEGSIEFNSMENVSTLNLHVDEILFFFENSDTNLLIIEDLDRFKNPVTIFTKLREINQLINRRKYNRGINKKVTFIYSVKDDLFINSEKYSKTKFFELIIPVIPFINYANSGDIFHKSFEGLENTDLEWTLIHEISLFVDDMRVLNNVFNEFIIYQKTINEKLRPEKVNPSKLFAMILLKNIEQVFFQNLQTSTNNFFEQALEVKSITISIIENELLEARQQTERGQIEKREELTTEIDDLKLSKLKNIYDNSDYYKRFLHAKLSYNNKDKAILDSALESDLVLYLINNGYLDESYQEYISLFHDNGRISHNDNKYIREVYNKRDSALKRKIDFPVRVIQWMKNEDFLQPYFLNIEIIVCLCNNQNEFAVKYRNFVKLLKKDPTSSYKVLPLVLFEVGFDYSKLVDDFLDGDRDSAMNIVYDCCNDNVKFTEVISRIVMSSGDSKLPDGNSYVKNVVENNSKEFFHLWSSDKYAIDNSIRDNYIAFLSSYKIKFESILDLGKNLYSILLRTNSYKLTLENVEKLIIKDIENVYFSESTGFLTYVKNKFELEIFGYFLDNLNIVLSFYENISLKHKESEEVMLEIFKNLENNKIEEKFASAQNSSFELLENILDEDLRKRIAEYGLFEANWQNIKICILNDYDINSFINKEFIAHLRLDLMLYGEEELAELDISELLKEAIERDVINESNLIQITSIEIFNKTLDFSEISELAHSKNFVAGLVMNETLTFSISCIEPLSEYGLDVSTDYVVKNFMEFLDGLNLFTEFNLLNIGLMLGMKNISIENRNILFIEYLKKYNSETRLTNEIANFVMFNFEMNKSSVISNWEFFINILTSKHIESHIREEMLSTLLLVEYNSINYIDQLLEFYAMETKEIVWKEERFVVGVQKTDLMETILNILQKINYISSFREKKSKFFGTKYIIYYKHNRPN